MYLSRFAKTVFIVIRRDSLASSMSQYLIDQIEETPNIQLLSGTQVVETHGNERLNGLTLKDVATGETRQVPAGSLFVFIGSRPSTDWLPDVILKNEKGFVLTGRDLQQHQEFAKNWPLHRNPFFLETAVPGIFTAGDARANAMNRVASAVGEGAMAIKLVHEYLAES